VPDGDLFTAMRAGRVSVETDHIERFTRTGIQLRSGKHLDADVIVTATGLELKCMGGVELTVDGQRVDPHSTLTYRGCMFSDVPNLACVFGYTNASWTLKADLTAEYICRLLRTMDSRGYQRCVPRKNVPGLEERPWLDFTSGYVQRGLARFPKQGSKPPFRVNQNYLFDLLELRYSPIEDGVLEWSSPNEANDTARPRSNRPRPQA
jgi:cation diffusion facilitator CzcD-associated flavoprotein CzcO